MLMQLVVYVIGVVALVVLNLIYNSISLNNLIFDEIVFYANFAPVWLIPAVIIHVFSKKSKWFLVGINLDKYAVRDILWGFFCALMSTGVIVFLGLLWGADVHSPETASAETIKKILITSFYILNFAAVEEFIFRGFIFQYFLRNYNKILIVLISSLLFSAAHYFNSNTNVLIYINSFIAGILFCLMYLKTRSMWLQISFHFVWNWATTVLFSKQVSLVGICSKDIVYKINFVTEHSFVENLLFGNDYNFESGILCTIVLLVMIFVVMKYVKPSYNINSAIFKYEYTS